MECRGGAQQTPGAPHDFALLAQWFPTRPPFSPVPATTSRVLRVPRSPLAKNWSTNPLERLNGEIRRRTRVVGSVPNDAAVLGLVSVVVAETHDERQDCERRYFAEHT